MSSSRPSTALVKYILPFIATEGNIHLYQSSPVRPNSLVQPSHLSFFARSTHRSLSAYRFRQGPRRNKVYTTTISSKKLVQGRCKCLKRGHFRLAPPAIYFLAINNGTKVSCLKRIKYFIAFRRYRHIAIAELIRDIPGANICGSFEGGSLLK